MKTLTLSKKLKVKKKSNYKEKLKIILEVTDRNINNQMNHFCRKFPILYQMKNDLIQDVYIKLIECIKEGVFDKQIMSSNEYIRSMVYVIIKNNVYDTLRKIKRDNEFIKPSPLDIENITSSKIIRPDTSLLMSECLDIVINQLSIYNTKGIKIIGELMTTRDSSYLRFPNIVALKKEVKAILMEE